jgi:hypothetical protein
VRFVEHIKPDNITQHTQHCRGRPDDHVGPVARAGDAERRGASQRTDHLGGR